jgi:hypothetical protein
MFRVGKKWFIGNLRGAKLPIISQKNKSLYQKVRNGKIRDLADLLM